MRAKVTTGDGRVQQGSSNESLFMDHNTVSETVLSRLTAGL